MTETTEIEYDSIGHATKDAIGFVIEGDEDNLVWVPNSLIEDHDRDEKTLSIPVWFALNEGLI